MQYTNKYIKEILGLEPNEVKSVETIFFECFKGGLKS